MSGFQPGDIVRITIDARVGQPRAGQSENDLTIQYRAELGMYEGTIAIDSEAVKVERVPVAFEQNALYADRSGHLWLAQQGADGGDDIHLHSSLGSCSIEQATEWYGPFRLVHREEAS